MTVSHLILSLHNWGVDRLFRNCVVYLQRYVPISKNCGAHRHLFGPTAASPAQRRQQTQEAAHVNNIAALTDKQT
jgi:hypothetical protein